ncbi:MAG: VOC family protein [Mucilaginibacter sp.]|uniref:VOC family protein n=1 Tax=Mucilaginibacter sp. TaxID=1882438 RepID=UPI00319FACCD
MTSKPTFAPQLVIPNGVTDISFYINAFGATELRRFSNDDGTIHVSELSINGALFHLHEQTQRIAAVSPDTHKSTTVTIGLFVDDVHAVVEQAIKSGARLQSAVQDYDYGYRQGEVVDPFGHQWLIEKAI